MLCFATISYLTKCSSCQCVSVPELQHSVSSAHHQRETESTHAVNYNDNNSPCVRFMSAVQRLSLECANKNHKVNFSGFLFSLELYCFMVQTSLGHSTNVCFIPFTVLEITDPYSQGGQGLVLGVLPKGTSVMSTWSEIQTGNPSVTNPLS